VTGCGHVGVVNIVNYAQAIGWSAARSTRSGELTLSPSRNKCDA